MDPMALPLMIFTVVVLSIVGGVILLFPLTRQLAAYLRRRLEAKDLDVASRLELLEVREALGAVEAQLHALSQRQEFTERLLDERAAPGLPRGAAGPVGASGPDATAGPDARDDDGSVAPRR